MQKRLAVYGQDNTGSINAQQFQQMLTEALLERDPADMVSNAFRLFDTKSTGRISVQDLKVIANELGQQVDDQDLLGMIDEFDLDRDGHINADEFQRIMNMAET